MEKITNYFREAMAELRKVTWPTKKETVNYTILVIGISLGVSLLLGGLDYVFNLGVGLLINKQL